jgi:aerobic carbon-monoxide dehydrogenase medium subunit
MIPQNFEYAAPASLKEALALISSGGKPLAGGMSLIPVMKLRLAAPGNVVDLGRIPNLNYIREDKDGIHVGAMTTHFEVESSRLLESRCPLLAEAASYIGDVQVRNMGTIGGSLAHNDPAADYPAALLALEARVTLTSGKGERTLPLSDFLLDMFSTALEPGEIVTEAIVPAESAGAGTAYVKAPQPASGFALVGIAVRLQNGFARVGVTGVGPKAYRATEVEALLEGGADAQKAAAAIAPKGMEINSDIHASSDYRRHLAQVYAARAIKLAQSRM